MIEAICKDCGTAFVACVVLGLTNCPDCKSSNTAVAIAKDGPLGAKEELGEQSHKS